MKNKELFEKTVSILVKAYLNDTLKHCNCHACAVGNLVAAGMGIKIIEGETGLDWSKYAPLWNRVFVTLAYSKEQNIYPQNFNGETKEQIVATGYNLYELASIEKAFETAEFSSNNEVYNFNGLMAVVDVLAEIHEVSQEEVIATKKMFAKV